MYEAVKEERDKLRWKVTSPGRLRVRPYIANRARGLGNLEQRPQFNALLMIRQVCSPASMSGGFEQGGPKYSEVLFTRGDAKKLVSKFSDIL